MLDRISNTPQNCVRVLISISDPLGISLPGGHSAVDSKSCARDPGCLVGGKIANHIGYLFRFAGSTDRIIGQDGSSFSGLLISGAAIGVSVSPGFTTLQRIPSLA